MTRRIAALALLACLLPFAGAHAASSWTARAWSEVRGGVLLFDDERGQTESYFTAEAKGDSTVVLRTTDSGLSWSPIGAAAPVPSGERIELRSLARDRATNDDLLLSTASGLAFRRNPTTGAWSEFGPPGEGAISAAAALPAAGLLASRRNAAADARLFRSTDDGATWTALPLSGLMSEISQLAGFASGPMWALDEASQLWRADSTTFTPAAPFAIRFVVVDSELEATALRADHRLARTTNGGVAWTEIAGNLSDAWGAETDSTFAFGTDEDLAWIASPRRMIVSTDGGTRWTVALEGDGLLSAIAWNPVQRDFLAGGAEVLLSSDEGASWQLRSGADFSRLALATPSSAFGVDHGLIATFDGGESWERWPFEGPSDRLGLLRFFGLSGFLSREGDVGPSLYLSNDRGRSWHVADEAPRGISGVVQTADGVSWAGAADGLYRSTDDGESFSRLETAPFTAVERMAASDSVLAITNAGELFHSTDAGATWTLHDAPEPGIEAIYVVNADTLFVAGSALYRSSDAGAHWQPIPDTANSGGRWRSIAGFDASALWASGDRGALASCLDGWSFQRYVDALEVGDRSVDLGTLTFEGSTGLCGSRARLLRYREDTLGPEFRLVAVFHPYLERSVHLYLTARERLEGDSIEVEIDSRREGIHADADPFLFHLLYDVPSGSTSRSLRVSGIDLAGNRRSTTIPFSTDRGSLVLRESEVELRWSTTGSGLLLAHGVASEGLPPLPTAWMPLGEPIRLQRRDGSVVRSSELRARALPANDDAASVRADVAVLVGNEWHLASREPHSLLSIDGAIDGAIVWPIRPPESDGTEDLVQSPNRLIAWPNPARMELRLALGAGTDGWWRGVLFDLAGRRLESRRIEVRGGDAAWPLDTRAAGRYWIRLQREGISSDTRTVAISVLAP